MNKEKMSWLKEDLLTNLMTLQERVCDSGTVEDAIAVTDYIMQNFTDADCQEDDSEAEENSEECEFTVVDFLAKFFGGDS